MELKWVDPYDSEKYIEIKKDHIVAKGGDGTLLRAVRMHHNLGLPFLPIAGGTENFLMNAEEVKPEECESITYNLLQVNWGNHGLGNRTLAFNEISIGSFCGWNTFRCDHKDNILGEFKGAGISVSTAQGSTGLNRNSGGPVLGLESDNWAVRGMSVNREVNYSLNPDEIEIETTNTRGEEFVLKVDGTTRVRKKDLIVVKLSQGPEVTVLYKDLDEIKKRRRL